MNISSHHEVLAYSAAVEAYRNGPVMHKGESARVAAFCAIPAACGFYAASKAASRIANLAIQSEQDAAALRAAMAGR